jgi:hypothetical protein
MFVITHYLQGSSLIILEDFRSKTTVLQASSTTNYFL